MKGMLPKRSSRPEQSEDALIILDVNMREEKILRMRFGIGEKHAHTLEEVGKVFDLTRERVRQIEAKALGKMKHFSRADKLRSFTEH